MSTSQNKFSMCRSLCFQGIKAQLQDKQLKIVEVSDMCFASELGYVEVGDTITSIDNEKFLSEADVLIEEPETSMNQIDIVVVPNSLSENEKLVKSYGERYLNLTEGIRSLKSTLRKDHIDIAIATMQQGDMAIENGDLDFGRDLIEDALNNAYGLNAGLNETVCDCYSSQAQIAYLENNTIEARRHLREALDVYKKIGSSQEVNQFKIINKIIAVASDDEDSTFRDTMVRQAMEIQQKVLTVQLLPSAEPSVEAARILLGMGRVLSDNGNVEDARECLEKALLVINRLYEQDLRVLKAEVLRALVTVRFLDRKVSVAKVEAAGALTIEEDLCREKDRLGVMNPKRIASMSLLAMAFIEDEDEEDVDKGIELMLKCLRFRQQYFGRRHPLVAETCHFLAIAHRRRGLFKEAFFYHHLAVHIYTLRYGPKNAITKSCVGALSITVAERHAKEVENAISCVDLTFTELKRSLISPFNPMCIQGCAWIRNQFYDHLRNAPRIRRSVDEEASVADSNDAASPSKSGGPSDFLMERGEVLLENECDYNSARVLFQQCYNYLADTVGFTHNATLHALYRLADATKELGNYADAEMLYSQAVDTYSENIGDKVAMSYAMTGWGDCYLVQGNYEAARLKFSEAINIQKSQMQLGVEGVDTTMTEFGLAKVAMAECKWAEAARLLDRLLNKVKADLGPQHIKTALVALQIAKCRRGMGKHEEIKPALDQCFVIMRAIRQEDHLHFAYALFEQAEYYCLMGEYKEAKPRYDKSLEIFIEFLTEGHPTVYTCRTRMAQYEVEQGRIPSALEEHENILKCIEDHMGSDCPYVGEGHIYTGDCLVLMGQFVEAQAHFEVAESILRKTYGKDHPMYARLVFSKAECARLHGHLEKARTLHAECMKIRRDAYGKEHPDYVSSLQGKADLDSNCDSNMEEVTVLLKRIIKLKKRYYGEEHTSMAHTLNTYGMVLKMQGKLEDALEKFHEADKIQAAIGDPQHYTLAVLKNNIALVNAALIGGEDNIIEPQTSVETNVTPPPGGVHEPRAPTEAYEGVVDQTPVFNNSKFRHAIAEMNSAVSFLRQTFPSTDNYEHPLIANIRGNIGIIEKLEDEGKRDFILRLSTKQRALFRDAEEKRLSEEFSNMSADFSDAPAGFVRLRAALLYLAEHDYGPLHPWIIKFEAQLKLETTDIPGDAEPQNAAQLKANRKLMEAREKMRLKQYDAAKRYYEETLAKLPDAEFRPEDTIAYAMAGECLSGLADIARIHCRLAESRDFYLRSLNILRKESDNESLQFADALLGYSDLLLIEGEFEESMVNIDTVVKIKKRHLGERHDGVVDTIFRRVLLKLSSGDYNDGFELCEYVLKARLGMKAHHEDMDFVTKIADTYNTMAQYHIVMADYAKAEECLSESLKTCRGIVGDKDDMAIADCYHLKGELRMAQYKFKEALRNFGHGLAMKLRIYSKSRASSTTPEGGSVVSDLPEEDMPPPSPEQFPYLTVALSLFSQAEALRQDGKFQLAAELYLKAAKMYGVIFDGADNPAIANVMFGQAENYRMFAKYENAEKMYDNVKKMRLRICKSSHPDLADALDGIGDLRTDQCRFEEAMKCYKESLAIRLKVFGKEHPKIAASYMRMANVERIYGRSVEAEKTYLKALSILKPLFGEAHAATCPCFFGIAENYRALERYNDAEVLYTLIVSVIAIAYGEGHYMVGQYVVGQSQNLAILGSYSESKVYAQRALQVFNKCFGSDHPSTLTALLNISRALLLGGRYEKAFSYLERCRDFNSQLFDPKAGPHLAVGDSYMECGNCLLGLGRYAEAKEQFQFALDVRRSLLSSEHPQTLMALSGMAEAEKALGHLPEAEQWQDEAVTQSQTISGNKMSLFGSLAMYRLAEVIRHRGKLQQAKQLHERALRVRQTIVGGKHYLVAESLLALGVVTMELSAFEEANGILEKSLNLGKLMHREQHPFLGLATYALAECSRCMGFHDAAESGYFKAVAIMTRDLPATHPEVVKMMLGYSENRKALGHIYLVNSDEPIDVSLGGPLAVAEDQVFNEDNIGNLNALPVLVKALKWLVDSYGDKHYDVLRAKGYLAHAMLLLGQLNEALALQRDLISGYRIHFGKEFMYMAPVLYGLAEIERVMEKVSAKKKLYTATNKPDLSAASITGGSSIHTAATTKSQRNPNQKLPKIQSIAEVNRAGQKKKPRGFQGYEYPEVKTRDINPDSPIDHLIMNEIEVALREKEEGSSGRSSKNADPATSMINESSRLYDIALQLHSERFPHHEKHPFTATILFSKAELLRGRREFDEAHALYKKAHSIQILTLRGGHPILGATLFGIAENLRMKGNLKEAQMFYDRSMLIRSDSFSFKDDGLPLHISIGESKTGLAALLYDKGFYYDAVIPCEEAIVIRRNSLGSEHMLTSQSEHLLANIYLSCQEFDKAGPLYEHAIKVKKTVFGPKHVQVISAMSDYALLLKIRGDYDRALVTFHKVRKTQSSLYGPTHPDIASSLNNIGAVHFAKGEFEEALPYYRDALEMKRTCFGNDHANVASALHNLAGVYQSLQQFDRARELYEEALVIQTSIYDYFHPCIADTMNNLGILLFSRGQHAEAEASYERALEIKQHVFGKDHPAYASSLHNLGALQHAQGRLTEAKVSYVRCRDIRMAHLGPNHPDTIACIENLRALKLQQIIDVEKAIGQSIEIYQ